MLPQHIIIHFIAPSCFRLHGSPSLSSYLDCRANIKYFGRLLPLKTSDSQGKIKFTRWPFPFKSTRCRSEFIGISQSWAVGICFHRSFTRICRHHPTVRRSSPVVARHATFFTLWLVGDLTGDRWYFFRALPLARDSYFALASRLPPFDWKAKKNYACSAEY